jgi:hypothetical protein
MDSFVNFSLLSPANAAIVVLTLIFVAMAGFVIYSNAGALIPHLPKA